ncbi:hypothetical protein EBR66_06020 [bacterium]|nr:hypothetical protein [bacterium]
MSVIEYDDAEFMRAGDAAPTSSPFDWEDTLARLEEGDPFLRAHFGQEEEDEWEASRRRYQATLDRGLMVKPIVARFEHPSSCGCSYCVPDGPGPIETFRAGAVYKSALKTFDLVTAEQLCHTACGGSWYDMFYPDGKDPEWDAVMEMYTLTQAEREAKEARSREAYRQNMIEEKVAIEARRNLKRNEQVEKNGRICLRLYSCVGDKHTGGAKPTTMHVSSECWSHERICPVTGNLLTPHKCPFLHPGEPGWHKEWMTNRLWQPAGMAEPKSRFNMAAPQNRRK